MQTKHGNKKVIRRRDGKTALHYAARNGHNEMIDLILSRKDAPSSVNTTSAQCPSDANKTSSIHSWTPSKPTFFDEQLNICRRLLADDDEQTPDVTRILERIHRRNNNTQLQQQQRSRFREHPRCTARFGEILRHSRDSAATELDYHQAVDNARAVVRYVDESMASTPSQASQNTRIREELVADVADALTSRALRNFRQRQLDCCAEEWREAKRNADVDFTPEEADLNVLGRLYYSAIRMTDPYLKEVALSADHGGFTTLLALCRAASAASAYKYSDTQLTEDGMRLDEAVSLHFNGISAPGSRFLYSPRHGLKRSRRGRCSRLIIAFSSLGNGLVRHEFGGSLAKIYSQLSDDDAFDVLFVADPSQSWYSKDSKGDFRGFEEYEKRIRAASRPYKYVSLVGDSMGGSAALFFSHLTTDSVVSFSPQVDLTGDSHVSRDDMTVEIRKQWRHRLIRSVQSALANDVECTIHRGTERNDIWHTELLSTGVFESAAHIEKEQTNKLRIIEHPDCHHHQIAVYLKHEGTLIDHLTKDLIER